MHPPSPPAADKLRTGHLQHEYGSERHAPCARTHDVACYAMQVLLVSEASSESLHDPLTEVIVMTFLNGGGGVKVVVATGFPVAT